MSQYFPPTLHNTTINSVFNSADFANQSGGTLTQTTADGRYILNTGRIPAITWTGNHTFSKAVALGASDASFSNTFGGLSNIFNSNIAANNAINLGQRYYLNYPYPVTGAISVAFAIPEIYYITPSASAYTITLPLITSTQVGAKLQLRVVNTAAGNVTLTPASGQSIYGTSSTTPIGTNATPLTIYTGGTTTISSYTFYALTTSLGGTYGWFQQ